VRATQVELSIWVFAVLLAAACFRALIVWEERRVTV
jgi:hypothetical protein